MEPSVIAALVVAIASALGVLVTQVHIQKCSAGCCESDCRISKEDRQVINEIKKAKSASPSPLVLQPILNESKI